MSQIIKIQEEEKVKEIQEEKTGPQKNYTEMMFTFTLEVIALFDLFGDVLFLIVLWQANHIIWFTLSIFTIMAPLYVCYVPLISVQRSKQNPSKLITFSAFTPLILVYLLLLDIFYIVIQTAINPILVMISMITCGKISGLALDDIIDEFFLKFFGLAKVQAVGFRKLRTLSQLTLESAPQMLLQVRIFFFLKATNSTNDKNLEVDESVLLFSLGCAVTHTVIEFILI